MTDTTVCHLEDCVCVIFRDKVDAYSGTYNTNLYVERRESSNSSTVLKSSDLFVHSTVVIRDVQDFQIQGEYMLASKKVVGPVLFFAPPGHLRGCQLSIPELSPLSKAYTDYPFLYSLPKD